MKDIASRKERFLLDDFPIRLGGIAANLARVVSFAGNPANRQAVLDLLDESKWFIEWAAPTADIDTAARLVEIQIQLACHERDLLSGKDDIDLLVSNAAKWRDETLEMSGLLV